MRPPSRQKTPTKAVGLDDMSGTPTTPDSRQVRLAIRPDDNIETIASLEPKGDLFRRKNIAKAKRTDDNQWVSSSDNKQTVEYEARNTYTHGSKAFKDYDLLDEWEPKGANYQGTQWFFENSRREEHTKDDSFVQIDFNNVYEMDGVVPLRQPDKFGLDDDDEPSKRGRLMCWPSRRRRTKSESTWGMAGQSACCQRVAECKQQRIERPEGDWGRTSSKSKNTIILYSDRWLGKQRFVAK